MPISCVFCVVEYANTLYTPTVTRISPMPPKIVITRKPNRGAVYSCSLMKSFNVPGLTRATPESVPQTSCRTAFAIVPGSCDVRTIRASGADPMIVYGIHTSGSIGTCRPPLFTTSATTPTISNHASCPATRSGPGPCEPHTTPDGIFVGQIPADERLVHNRDFSRIIDLRLAEGPSSRELNSQHPEIFLADVLKQRQPLFPVRLSCDLHLALAATVRRKGA